MSGPIDAYLDELVTRLSTRRPRQLRSLVAEAEAHLRDDADTRVATGSTRDDAERAAVARFGPADLVAGAERATWRAPLSVIAQQFVGSALLLGGIGAIAVGISGAVALVVRVLSSARFLVDTPTAAVLTPSNCARWLGSHGAVSPGPGCRNAAISDWVSEVIGYRLAAGMLGVLVVLLVELVRRRRGLLLLPPQVSDTIGAAAFAAAGVWLLATGIDAIVVSHGDGAGQWISAAPVALAAAAVFALRLIRELQNPEVAGEPAR
jgi:hypothetical protein